MNIGDTVKNGHFRVSKTMNGWMLTPSYSESSGYAYGPGEIYVFKDVGEMTVWMAKNLKEPEQAKE